MTGVQTCALPISGGFIGGALVARLLAQGVRDVRCVDIKPLAEWQRRFEGCDNRVADLRSAAACEAACAGREVVFNLACDMGGIGFIETRKADCMISVLINTNMLVAARAAGVRRFFYSSSACVYAADKQTGTQVSLKEPDAYPAMPEDGYGWEKLFSERMARHFREDFGLTTRMARYHNVYGPEGTWTGGREKAPAAICRKVAEVPDGGEIEVWGDGTAVRSYTYVDDLVDGILLLTASDRDEPANIGNPEYVSVNELVATVAAVAGKTVTIRHIDGPVGVQSRNFANNAIEKLGFRANFPLRAGIERTYPWVAAQVEAARAAG